MVVVVSGRRREGCCELLVALSDDLRCWEAMELTETVLSWPRDLNRERGDGNRVCVACEDRRWSPTDGPTGAGLCANRQA